MDPEVRGKTASGWLWVYARPKGGVLFDFQRSRGRAGPDEILKTFSGTIQSGGYALYGEMERAVPGLKRLAVIYSVLMIARRYGLEAVAWLTDVLRRIPPWGWAYAYSSATESPRWPRAVEAESTKNPAYLKNPKVPRLYRTLSQSYRRRMLGLVCSDIRRARQKSTPPVNMSRPRKRQSHQPWNTRLATRMSRSRRLAR